MTVPTVTMIFDSRSSALVVSLTMREREIGGRLIFDWNRRLRITYRIRQAILLPLHIVLYDNCHTDFVERAVCPACQEAVQLVESPLSDRT